MKKYVVSLKHKNIEIGKREFNTLKECKECLKENKCSGVVRLSKTNDIKLIWVSC